jgi:hypothetical protein
MPTPTRKFCVRPLKFCGRAWKFRVRPQKFLDVSVPLEWGEEIIYTHLSSFPPTVACAFAHHTNLQKSFTPPLKVTQPLFELLVISTCEIEFGSGLESPWARESAEIGSPSILQYVFVTFRAFGLLDG